MVNNKAKLYELGGTLPDNAPQVGQEEGSGGASGRRASLSGNLFPQVGTAPRAVLFVL
jgi:hypothetical protein